MKIEHISINKLHLDKENIRTKVDQNEIKRLTESLKEVGVLDPIKIDQNNVIIDGNRRYLAAKMAGLKELPVIRRESNKTQKKIEQITHDVLNLPLTPYEKAKAIYNLRDLGLTKKEICKKFSLTPSWVEDVFLILSDKKSEEIAKSGEVDFFKISEAVKGLEKKDADKLLNAVRKNPDLTVHKDIRPMRDVLKNKEISEDVKDSVLTGDITVEQAMRLKGLNKEKQDVGVHAIKKMKKHIDTIPRILEKGEVKTTTDQKKISAQQLVEKLQDVILRTGSEMSTIESALEQIEEDKLDQYFNNNMKQALAECLSELKDSIFPTMKRIESSINKWRK